MMRVPKRIESGESVHGPRQLDDIPSGAASGKEVCNGHEKHHEQSSEDFTREEDLGVSGLTVTKVSGDGGVESVAVCLGDSGEVASEMEATMQDNSENDSTCDKLVQVEAVIEGEDIAEEGGAKPGDGVPADREENKRHVELEGLGCALGGAHAIAHHLETIAMLVLQKLPHEQTCHGSYPQAYHPHALPFIMHEELALAYQLPQRSSLVVAIW